MKKLSLFSLMLMAASMFLFLGGCRKDEVIKSHEMIVSPGTVSSEPIQEYLSLSKIVKLERYFKRNKEVFSARNALKLDTSRVLMVKFDDSYLTYSIKILNEKEGAIQNVIFLERNGVLSEPNILEFQGTRNFVESFNKRLIGFDKFEGTMTQYTMEKYLSQGRSGYIDCNCFKEFIKPIIEGESGPSSNSSDQGTGGFGLGGFGGFGNLGHGTNAGQDAFFGTITSTSNNPPPPPLNSFNCPPGFLTIYIFGVKYCIPWTGGSGGGDKGGGQNGELETFGSGQQGLRTTEEECIKLIRGVGISNGESNYLPPYTATNDPISNQIRSCFDNPEITKKIAELKSLEIFDPCTNQAIEIDVDELALDLCFGCGNEGAALTSESLEDAYFEALEGVDHINVSVNLQTLCPLWDCLFDKLVKGQLQTDFVCDLKSQFDGSTGSNKGVGFHMHIVASDFTKNPKNLDPNASGVTSILKGRPVISINSSNCKQNNDLFDIFDTFQHEMIHANILQDLLNNGWSGTNTDYASAFHALVLQKYGTNAGKTEHELMLNVFVKDMVQSLIDANGGKGTYADFEGLVLKGFGQDLLKYTKYTQIDINNKMAVYNNFVSNPANVSPNFVSCP